FAPEAARSPTPGAPPRPTLVLTGVNFETGRSILTRDSYMVLDAVAASLVANPDIRIEVAGYTDSTGRKFTNLRLSQGRAAAVRHRPGAVLPRSRPRGYRPRGRCWGSSRATTGSSPIGRPSSATTRRSPRRAIGCGTASWGTAPSAPR